jgi:hypothetical protein
MVLDAGGSIGQIESAQNAVHSHSRNIPGTLWPSNRQNLRHSLAPDAGPPQWSYWFAVVGVAELCFARASGGRCVTDGPLGRLKTTASIALITLCCMA